MIKPLAEYLYADVDEQKASKKTRIETPVGTYTCRRCKWRVEWSNVADMERFWTAVMNHRCDDQTMPITHIEPIQIQVTWHKRYGRVDNFPINPQNLADMIKLSPHIKRIRVYES